VTLVVSWLEQGIPEGARRTGRHGDPGGRQRAVVLWPDEADLEPGGAWRNSTIVAEASGDGPP
jgi:hypothetical protein